MDQGGLRRVQQSTHVSIYNANALAVGGGMIQFSRTATKTDLNCSSIYADFSAKIASPN